MFCIVDCNNFYVSCERLFAPRLHDKAIVVLSNNDGCTIARSNEAKALGIKMGEPYFKIKRLCSQHDVHIFSSNYAFYGDMSRRVMSVIEDNWPEVEIYSIDEAFLDLTSMNRQCIASFCQRLQKIVNKSTGIPVSIGIGATKTLAKLANHIAKKELRTPVFQLSSNSNWLSKIDVGEVWGVGRGWAKTLNAHGIRTVYDLAASNHRLIKSKYNVVLSRTVLELQGIACLGLAPPEIKKSIVSSRSFGFLQTDIEPIGGALSAYVARAVEKLRKQHSKAGHISVSLSGNPFREDLPYYAKSFGLKLLHPSDDVREITHFAKWCLNKIYAPGFYYKKVGIFLDELVDKHHTQYTLFSEIEDTISERQERFMSVVASINQKFGRDTVRLAATGYSHSAKMKSNHRSKNYTTSWSDLPLIT